MRLIGLAFLAFCLAVSAQTVRLNPSQLSDTTFDPYFERWSKRWMPEYDWRWFRAQCYQESRFDPHARSHAGAMGICQLMPGTARDLGISHPYNANDNIYGGAKYMRRMLNIWVWERTDAERLELAQASYNAGAGNIIKAQRVCESKKTWDQIKICLPQITGHHSEETIGYVSRIKRWYSLSTINSNNKTECQ